MKKRLLVNIALLLLLALVPTAHGQDSGFPACSRSDLLVVNGALLDYQIIGETPLETIDDLVAYSSLNIQSRDSSLSLLPLCRAAILTQRQFIALYGDLAGGSMLERAGMSRSANPYFALNLVDETRIDRDLEELLAVADKAPDDDQRKLRLCSSKENDLLDELAAEFLNIDLSPAAAQNPLSLSAINFILTWRDEKLPLLPECAQAIEFGFLLSKASTDAAALLAFRYADVPEGDNPYSQLVGQARESLSTWRQDLMIIQPQYKEATVLALGPASELPPCDIRGIRSGYNVLTIKVLEVAEMVETVESGADLLAYEQAHLELLESTLAPLPLCAELFEFNWLARNLLANGAAWAASKVLGLETNENPFTRQMRDTGTDILAWIDNAKAILDSDDQSAPLTTERPEPPACRPGEALLVIEYIAPDFLTFVKAGRNMESSEDLFALFDHSRSLREQLWQDLPRCREALEIGLVMQQVAGDWIAMITLDIAGADSEDFVPYLAQVRSGVARFEELSDGFSQASPSVGKIYYVTADPYANIRSCAATSCSIVTTAQNGEALIVVDDSSDWYELLLEDGRAGYIAGFLMSEARPAS